MENLINICMSPDDNFVEVTTLAMISVVESAAANTQFHFYIIDNNISAENKRIMTDTSETYGFCIDFLTNENAESEVSDKIEFGRWTFSTMQRLFLCRIMPTEVERVLYLDGDILVRKPLDELYNTDLGDNYYIAGVQDCISPQNKINVGMQTDDRYINAGVILINIAKWRKDNIEQQLLAYCKEDKYILQYPDQDTINSVMRGHIKIVHPRYNAYTMMFNYSYADALKYRSANVYYSQKEYDEAVADPAIVHFTSDAASVRVWYKNGKHKYRSEWLAVRSKSFWKDRPLAEDNRPLKAKAKTFFFRHLPKGIAVDLARRTNIKHTNQHKS